MFYASWVLIKLEIDLVNTREQYEFKHNSPRGIALDVRICSYSWYMSLTDDCVDVNAVI